MLYELYISSLMKSDLNLRLSSQQHPGSARLAREWCGLKVKGLLLMLLIVHLWIRRSGATDRELSALTIHTLRIQISFPSSFPSNQHTITLCWSCLHHSSASSFASSPQVLTHFTWRQESRYGIQSWIAFISVLAVLQAHLQRTKFLFVKWWMWKVFPLLLA